MRANLKYQTEKDLVGENKRTELGLEGKKISRITRNEMMPTD